jgi:predicted protein tyrosine phosphatase
MSKTSPELVVLSREAAERYKPRGLEVCISITDPEGEAAPLSPAFAAVLRLAFNDITERGVPADVLFSVADAQKITAFLDDWPRVERVVVHCFAGVSRSPGVALGLSDLRGWPTNALEEAYPGWNRLVRTVLAGCGSGGGVSGPPDPLLSHP